MGPAVINHKNISKLYKAATALAIFTILYNLLEGFVSVYFGFEDESLTLFGFGVDSFIEVISGIGIAHMIYRIQINPKANRDNFERTALRITGAAFYILVVGLVASSCFGKAASFKTLQNRLQFRIYQRMAGKTYFYCKKT